MQLPSQKFDNLLSKQKLKTILKCFSITKIHIRWTLFNTSLALSVVLMATEYAGAQSVNPSPSEVAQEGLRRQEERTREQLQQLAPAQDVLRPEVKEKILVELPLETPCFPIAEFHFTGKSSERFSWLRNELLSYQGRCIGVEGLGRLASLLDAKLVEWGYATTKITLPAQNLSSGILIFNIHVGRVSAIHIVQAGTEKTPDENWGTWRNAFPVSAGDILNIRDLEQGTEQMQRLPSQAVKNRIEPGDEPDTSVIVIERQVGTFADRVRGGFTFDNSGSQSLGRTQFSGNASFDNPLGLNDILSISASSNAESPRSDHRSQSGSLSYSIPFGYSTLSYTKSESRFAQTVQGTTVNFLSSGSSSSDEFRLSHIALRSASAKFGVYAALSTRRAESYLDDVELIVQRRRTTNFEVGMNYKKLVGDANFDFELGYRRGVPWKKAEDDFEDNDNGLTLRPKIWLLSASFADPFAIGKQPFQYSATLRGQHTSDTTLSIDQLSIGNRYSVRGFDGDSVLLAESGFYLRNEIATQLNCIDGVNTQIYVGVDVGRVWGPSDVALIGTKLAGAALGLRGQWKSMQWDVAAATPLYKPEGFRTHNLNVYASLTYSF
jgi:hemolysin activation/secretion protein